MSRTLTVTTDPGRFREPFRIAGHVFEGLPLVRVVLSEAGREGRGEAGGVYYLNDDPAHMLSEIERVRGAVIRGADRQALLSLLPPGGARNALDAALWDLEAQLSGRPAWRTAGLDRHEPRTTTYTLGADTRPDITVALGRCRDARALKLKLDGDFDADVERLRFVHAERPDAWLMADANQAYDRATLERLMPILEACDVRLIEQPVRQGHEASLENARFPIPLAADESALSCVDIPGLVGRFQAVNIKLDKCGGLTEALAMARIARAMGLQVMVGNMGGSSLAAAPAYVLAQICDVVDLDGPLFLEADLPGGAVYRDGRIGFPSGFWGETDLLLRPD